MMELIIEVFSLEFVILLGIILAAYLYYHSSMKQPTKTLANDSFAHPVLSPPEYSKWRRNCRLLEMYGVNEVQTIEDKFTTLEDVSLALRKAGLQKTNLIFGIDFTVSNFHQGEKTFLGKCLHDLSAGENPYQQVIQILGETLEPFDEDGIIPAFGFGDQTTKDYGVFPLGEALTCYGFRDVLQAYNEVLSHVRLSGPTNFAPLIYRSLEIVRSTKKYHILVIVADGQVTSERATRQAIIDASYWPLSIIMIGVGDGPWDMMAEFDNSLTGRKFDNFQFVDFHAVTTRARSCKALFALQALMEIPDQYLSIRRLCLLHINED